MDVQGLHHAQLPYVEFHQYISIAAFTFWERFFGNKSLRRNVHLSAEILSSLAKN